MKKVMFSLLALSLMVPVIGQNQIEMERVAKEAKEKSTKIDSVSSRVFRELRAAPRRAQTFAQKLLNFE